MPRERDEEETAEEAEKKARSTTDLQRIKLERLLKNIDKPAPIPEPKKERAPAPPPEFVRNVVGSSAGAGSADFHIYRNNRKRELARLEFIDKQAHKEELNKEFQERLEEHKREAEERTAKKRTKRVECICTVNACANMDKKQPRKKKDDRSKSSKKEKEEEEEENDSSSDDGDNDDEKSDRSLKDIESLSIVDDPETPSVNPERKETKVMRWFKERRERLKKMHHDDESDPIRIHEEDIPDLGKHVSIQTLNTSTKAFCEHVLKRGVRGLREEFAAVRNYFPEKQSIKAFKDNPRKNRYNDVFCADETRVKLRDGNSNYIHASYVRGTNLTYICTQGPIQRTVVDFWRMVYQEKCKVILMLCDTTEKGRKRTAEYWPRELGATKILPNKLSITNVAVRCFPIKDQQAIFSTDLTLKKKNETHNLTHYLWSGWPDKAVPDSSAAVLNLIKRLPSDTPITVHCTAGVGRTGALVAVALGLEKLNKNEPLMGTKLVKELRNQRMHCIQSELHYLFINRVILEHFIEEEKWPFDKRVVKFLIQYEKHIKERTSE